MPNAGRMGFDTFFGLPAHPLLVHLPIVLVPILTLATLALAINKDWRNRYSPAVAVVGAGTALATILAAGAGEKLAEQVGSGGLIGDHIDLGEQTRIIVPLFAIVLIGLAAAVRYGSERLAAVMSVLALLAAAVATTWVVRTGHAGSKAVWQGVGEVDVESGGD